jgi:hypothetical protein
MLFHSRKAEKQEQQKKELLGPIKSAVASTGSGTDRVKLLMANLDSQIKLKKPKRNEPGLFEYNPENADDSAISRMRNVDAHREMHDEYSAEMLNFVSIMKANSQNINQILKEDNKSADNLHHLMSNAHGRLVSNNDSLNNFSKRSRKTTWLMWFILILVIFMFIATFLFMKVFSKKAS